MLPQPDPQVLNSNPQFAALYQDLAKTKIQGNGSSRAGGDKRGVVLRGEFEDALHRARVEEAKKRILKETITAIGLEAPVSSSGDGRDGLSDELRQTLQIVSAQLDGQIGSADLDIVEGEVEFFLDETSQIEESINDHLSQTTALLCRIAKPKQPPTPTSLVPILRTLIQHRNNLETDLHSTRTTLSTQTSTLLTHSTNLQQTAILLLEQTLHGQTARHIRAQSHYLRILATSLHAKQAVLEAQLASTVWSDERRERVREKLEDVDGEIRRMARERRVKGAVLEELEQLGRGLVVVAEGARACREEGERVREEVARLEGGRYDWARSSTRGD